MSINLINHMHFCIISDDYPTQIGCDSFGNVYVIGFLDYVAPDKYDDILFIKYNSDGNEEWVKIIDGGLEGFDQGVDLLVDSENNIYITSFINSLVTDSNADIITQKYKTNGELIWSDIIDTNIPEQGKHYDLPHHILLDSENNLILAGSNGGSDNILVKYLKNGSRAWIKTWANATTSV